MNLFLALGGLLALLLGIYLLITLFKPEVFE